MAEICNKSYMTFCYTSRTLSQSEGLLTVVILFRFGDTFCKNNAGLFLGLTDNTCAITTDPSNPTVSSYKHRDPLGEDIIKPFIKLEEYEIRRGEKIVSAPSIFSVPFQSSYISFEHGLGLWRQPPMSLKHLDTSIISPEIQN